MSCLYPVPSWEKKLLWLPKVHALVIAVTKKTTIQVEGGAALKDLQDKKLEMLLKQVFEVSTLTLQAVVCGAYVARAFAGGGVR